MTLVHQQNDTIDLMLDDAEIHHPEQSTLTVMTPTQEPTTLGRALHHFWSQYWQRDNVDDTWTEFDTMLRETQPLPEISNNVERVDWLMAIKKLKKTTGRGLCGWGTEELQKLPFQAIEDLRFVFQLHMEKGLPPDLMQARTIPLGKVLLPTQPSQTRPITILSLLYRTWGKVHCSKILQHWATNMPTSIVGFLPTRTLGTAMMRFQHRLELTHADQLPSQGGLTLDLIKAFNLIPRAPAKKALIHTGVPCQWAEMWYQSINKMQRRWEVAGSVTHLYEVTTGAPEGDTWSVLCMISLSYVWVQQLLLRCSSDLRPLVYADNLGWSTVDARDHGKAMEVTSRWTQALKLKVDWTKTWTWATDEAHRDAWSSELRDREHPDVHRARNARELGYMLAYQKTQSRLTFKQRFAEGLSQLRKIAALPHDLQTKALLTKAPLSKILFGTEIHAIGMNYHKQLRTALTRAMLGPHTQANPYVAMVTLSDHIQDPVVVAALHCFRQVRHMLHTLGEEEQKVFLHHAAHHNGQPLQVRGPAGALKHNVRNLGWFLDANGKVKIDGLVELSILTSPWEQLRQAVSQAWIEMIPALMSTRKEWIAPPLIDEITTKALLKKFPDGSKKILAFEITGAYQTARQKSKWVEGRDDTCPLCNETDSVYHRRIECPALAGVRSEHSEIVSTLKELHPINVYLPVVYQSQLMTLDRALEWKAPPMQPVPEVFAQAQKEIQDGGRPMFWTDGSAAPPQHPAYRTAAFAIVYLPKAAYHEVRHMYKDFSNTGKPPSQFLTFGVARTQGPQSIPRSELMAVLELVLTVDAGHVISDSQYVLDMAAAIQRGEPVEFLKQKPNGDLLERLAARLCSPDVNFVFSKVSSHQELHSDMSDETLLHALGNEAADKAAKQARVDLADAVKFHKIDEALQHRSMVQEHYELCLAINRKRLTLESCAETEVGKTGQEQVEELFRVQTENLIYPPPPVHAEDILKWSLWGEGLTEALWLWLQGLQWPPEAFADAGRSSVLDPGISWIEMLLDFQQTTQIVFPMNTGERGKPLQLISPTIHQHAHLGDHSLAATVKCFQAALAHISRLLGSPVIPKQRKTTKTLYAYGAGHYPQGIAWRPCLWNQAQMQHFLQEHFKKHPRTWTFPDMPQFLADVPKITVRWTQNEKAPRQDEGLLRKQALARKLKDRNFR